jgi:hypothetical protein
MKASKHPVSEGLAIGLVILFAGVLAWGQEYSHVRIVRLSFTEGTVTVQRPDVEEWAAAPANTPIQEGFKISTEENAFAEVEFENSSTARIGQLSLLEFTQLALLPSGGKLNRLTLHQGYATFNVIPEGDDFYEVTAGGTTLTPSGKTRFRVDSDQGMLLVKVFKGSVEVNGPEGNGTLGKNTVLEVRPGEGEPFQISQGITKDSWDEWVEERENRVEMVRNQGAPAPYSNNVSDLLFGYMDLVSYGDWISVPGYGYGWTPYANAGWSPFTAGRWCWYPSMGYTWISSEPWGWLPYHYGNWVYQPGFGWVWFPSSFTSWSPAQVNWYRGPGWVGWTPRPPRSTGGTGGSGWNHCPQPRGCVTTVNEDTLRYGRPVLPNRRDDIDPRGGQIVERPDIQADRLASLPGDPQSYPAAFRSRQVEDRTGAAAGRIIPTRPNVENAGGGTIPARPGIVFDPEQRRYVNDPNQRSIPAAPAPTASASEVNTRRAPAGPGNAGRPGPQNNYPLPVAVGRYGDRPAADGRVGPARDDSGFDWSGARISRGAGPRADESRPVGVRSNERMSSPGAATRSVPASVGSRGSGGDPGRSSSRSDSGRSSSASSSGGISRSSGSSSSGSSGWSTGSGSSSHSSGVGGGSSSTSSGGGGGGSHGSSSGPHSSSSPRR